MFERQSLAILIPMMIFCIIDMVIFVRSIQQGYETPASKSFCHFCAFVTGLQLISLICYSSDYHVFTMPIWAKYVINTAGIVLITVIGFEWLMYMLISSPGMEKWWTKPMRVMYAMPIWLLLVACISSPWTHLVFYIDETGVYHEGTVVVLQMFSYLYFLFAFFLLLFFTDRGRSKNTVKRFLLFMIPGLLGGLTNVLVYRGGYVQLGCSVGALMLYLEQYLIDVNENNRLRSLDEVNRRLLDVNEELKAARDAADRASRAKTRFLFNMSHDIRTPMNAIIGYTDIALNQSRDEATKQYLEKIKVSSHHLLRLINDILEMSRIESGKLQIVNSPVDVRQAAEMVKNMGLSLAMTKKINMEVQIGEISAPYVYADELHINEVLINLISNAVKYTPSGGCVVYRMEQLGEVKDGKISIRMEIRDNGIGMSEEFQRHLFEAFSREQNTTVSRVEGTGLGLSIVKNILDQAGGTISVSSKQGEGTTFRVEITFDVMEQEAIDAFLHQNQPERALDESVSLEGKRILYVEDNEINMEIGVELLTEAGLIVDTAGNGEVALTKLKELGFDRYDAILMDIQMPVMDGYEATRAIRAKREGKEIPIIALSANAFNEDIQQSLAVGMDAHVAKPINVGELLETLRRFLKP